MAVLIEAISIVIRIETIAEKYPGGLEQYVRDCPNRTLCMDDTIVRVGFMTDEDAFDFIVSLERLGLRCVVDDEYDEVAVVDQFNGIDLSCDWLEYAHVVIFKGDLRLSICGLKGSPLTQVEVPKWWTYETSLSKQTMVIDSQEFESRLTFLRKEKGLNFFLDKLTGKEVAIERTAKRNANA